MTSEDIDRLWDYQHPEVTEHRFRDLLAHLELESLARAEILTQLARAQGLQGNFTDGHRTLDIAEALLNQDAPRALRPRIRCQLERGRLHNSAGQPDTAKPFFLAAWEQATQSGDDFYAADAAHMLGIVGTPEEQLTWNRRALHFAEQSTDLRTKRWITPIANNLGWTLFDTGDYTAALDFFQRALHHREEAAEPTEIRIAKWCVAKTLRHLNRLDESLAIQRTLQRELAAAGESDPYVDEELAELDKLLPIATPPS